MQSIDVTAKCSKLWRLHRGSAVFVAKRAWLWRRRPWICAVDDSGDFERSVCQRGQRTPQVVAPRDWRMRSRMPNAACASHGGVSSSTEEEKHDGARRNS